MTTLKDRVSALENSLTHRTSYAIRKTTVGETSKTEKERKKQKEETKCDTSANGTGKSYLSSRNNYNPSKEKSESNTEHPFGTYSMCTTGDPYGGRSKDISQPPQSDIQSHGRNISSENNTTSNTSECVQPTLQIPMSRPTAYNPVICYSQSPPSRSYQLFRLM